MKQMLEPEYQPPPAALIQDGRGQVQHEQRRPTYHHWHARDGEMSARITCESNQFHCLDHEFCADLQLVCDGEFDCTDGSDEKYCPDSSDGKFKSSAGLKLCMKSSAGMRMASI